MERSSARSQQVLVVFSLGLLLALAMARADELEWPEYIRLLAVLAGFGVLGWKDRSWWNPGLLALALILVAAPLCAVEGKGIGLFLLSGLVLVAIVGVGKGWRMKLSLLEGTAAGVALSVFALSGIVGYLFNLQGIWISNWQWILYLAIWMLYKRWLQGMEGKRGWFKAGVVVVLAFVSLVGCMRIGSAFYHFSCGEWAAREADYQAAQRHYEEGVRRAQALGMGGLSGRSRLGLARSLKALGKEEEGAAALGMQSGWKRVIDQEEWEGPTGSLLYKNVSCWKDLWFGPGQVEMRVLARGQAARGIWPRLQVRLGERLLGEVEVTSAEMREYFFSTAVEAGVWRLEIALLNGFWEPGGEHRWIELGKAEVEYRQLDW